MSALTEARLVDFVTTAFGGEVVATISRWAPPPPAPAAVAAILAHALGQPRRRRHRARRVPMPADWLCFLLSPIFSASLDDEHLADLRKSGLTDATIRAQRFTTIPPWLFPKLLRFSPPSGVRTGYAIPYFGADGQLMAHVRIKVFPTIVMKRKTVKYLAPPRSSPGLFIPVATRAHALHGNEAVWLIEGQKKACAAAQLGLPALGFEGIEGWHRRGSAQLLPDFDQVRLQGRVVELVPDSDAATNPKVALGVARLADALRARGAGPRLVRLPESLDGE